MSAQIIPFPQGGGAKPKRSPRRGFEESSARKWLPLRIEDAEFITKRLASRNPIDWQRANSLLACCMNLRHYPAHPQGGIAAEIVRRVIQPCASAPPEAA